MQTGAIFVDAEARDYLHKALARIGLSPDDVEEYVKAGVKDFEAHAKRAFQDENTEHMVTVAHSRFNNTSTRTRRGRMTLDGWVVPEIQSNLI